MCLYKSYNSTYKCKMLLKAMSMNTQYFTVLYTSSDAAGVIVSSILQSVMIERAITKLAILINDPMCMRAIGVYLWLLPLE